MRRILIACFASVLYVSIGIFVASAADAAELPHSNVPMLAKMPSMQGRIDETWKGSARVVLEYDFTNRRRVVHPTVVYVAQDPKGLDFAFVVRERGNVAASTVSNGSAIFGDDNVQVSLEPQGVQGFSYQFTANPRGDTFAVIALNFDGAVFHRAAATAELLERLRSGHELGFGEPVNDARATRAPPLSRDANDPIFGEQRRPGLCVARALGHRGIDSPVLA